LKRAVLSVIIYNGSPRGRPQRVRRTVIENYQSQTHLKWESKYHGAVVPNYHRKALYGKLRPRVGEILRHLCRQKGRGLEEGKAMAEHIHMLLSVLPKYSIAILDI
jgi:putative transposase